MNNMTNNTMPAMNGTTDDEAALTRFLSTDASPVATPAMLVKLGEWLRVTIKKELEEHPVSGGQEWLRLGDVMRQYKVSKSQANNWLRRLKADGKVRTHTPIYGARGTGTTFYNAKDIDAAFSENSQRLQQR